MTASDSHSAKYHRVRIAIPKEDEWVKRWIDEQQSPSVSIRAMIREYIERHGYGDMFARPVDQLPRRGRPPGRSSTHSSDSPDSSEAQGSQDVQDDVQSVQDSPELSGSGAPALTEDSASEPVQQPAKRGSKPESRPASVRSVRSPAPAADELERQQSISGMLDGSQAGAVSAVSAAQGSDVGSTIMEDFG